MKKMNKKVLNGFAAALVAIIMMVTFFCGRTTTTMAEEGTLNSIESIKLPRICESEAIDYNGFLFDVNTTNEGYINIMSTYDDHNRLKVIISKDDNKYTYNLEKDYEFITYPLNMGDGDYSVSIYENIEGTYYNLLTSMDFNVVLDNEYTSFLYPSVIVDYNKESESTKLSFELCEGKTTDIQKIKAISDYIRENINYDFAKAEKTNYYMTADIEETLSSKEGICYDYASLMVAMLRVQNIPCKLVTGYVEDGYHAWVEVYTKEEGRMNFRHSFNGQDYEMIDITSEANGLFYFNNYEKYLEY